MEGCIFCQIAKKEMSGHILYEDESFMAFLSIFPNTSGVTVVIPKAHYGSYLFDVPHAIVCDLMGVARKVGKALDTAFADVGRTGVVFEGFGVNHLHAKLYPMHGTADMKTWKPMERMRNEFYEVYPGFLSSHDAQEADERELDSIVNMVRRELK